MDTPNLLTAIIAVIFGIGLALWILALLYDFIIRWPRDRARMAYWHRHGCRCLRAWDGVHEDTCQFREEVTR
jgi:hypothetical protein